MLWKIGTFDVNLDTNGGNLTDDDIIHIQYDSSDYDIEGPHRDGYTFIGWYDQNGVQY